MTAASQSEGLPLDGRSRGRQSRDTPPVAQERTISTFSAPASILPGAAVRLGVVLEVRILDHLAVSAVS